MHQTTRHRWRGRRGDAGYSVLEVAIVLPVMFLLLMLIVQCAIVWHARNVAAAAAQEGLRSAEAYGATAAQGRADTVSYLKQVAPHALPRPQVSVIRGITTATVQIHAPVMTCGPHDGFRSGECGPWPYLAAVSQEST